MEDEVLGKACDARIMRRLLAYMRPYRGTVLNSLRQILGPLLTKLVVDRYIAPAPSHCYGLLDRFLPDSWTGIAIISAVNCPDVLAGLGR